MKRRVTIWMMLWADVVCVGGQGWGTTSFLLVVIAIFSAPIYLLTAKIWGNDYRDHMAQAYGRLRRWRYLREKRLNPLPTQQLAALRSWKRAAF